MNNVQKGTAEWRAGYEAAREQAAAYATQAEDNNIAEWKRWGTSYLEGRHEMAGNIAEWVRQMQPKEASDGE